MDTDSNHIFSILFTDTKNKKVTIEFSNFQSEEEQQRFIFEINNLLGLFSLVSKDSSLTKTIH